MFRISRRSAILGGAAALFARPAWPAGYPFEGAVSGTAPFNGTPRMIGPGQTYATIAAAQTAASNGDRLICVPTTPRESLTITKDILLDISACVWNFNGVPESSLAGGGKGVIEVFAPNNCVIYAGDITGAGLDASSADLCSAIRVTPTGSNANVVVYGGFLHGNQNGITSGDGAVTITVIGSRLDNNGLAADPSHAHNTYFGFNTRVFLQNVISTNPAFAHAIKCKAAITTVHGGLFESQHGKCIDMPFAGFFALQGVTLRKLPTSDDTGYLTYGSEGSTNGFVNTNWFRGVTLDLQLACAMLTNGGTMTFLEGCTKTGTSPTKVGAGIVIGTP